MSESERTISVSTRHMLAGIQGNATPDVAGVTPSRLGEMYFLTPDEVSGRAFQAWIAMQRDSGLAWVPITTGGSGGGGDDYVDQALASLIDQNVQKADVITTHIRAGDFGKRTNLVVKSTSLIRIYLPKIVDGAQIPVDNEIREGTRIHIANFGTGRTSLYSVSPDKFMKDFTTGTPTSSYTINGGIYTDIIAAKNEDGSFIWVVSNTPVDVSADIEAMETQINAALTEIGLVDIKVNANSVNIEDLLEEDIAIDARLDALEAGGIPPGGGGGSYDDTEVRTLIKANADDIDVIENAIVDMSAEWTGLFNEIQADISAEIVVVDNKVNANSINIEGLMTEDDTLSARIDVLEAGGEGHPPLPELEADKFLCVNPEGTAFVNSDLTQTQTRELASFAAATVSGDTCLNTRCLGSDTAVTSGDISQTYFCSSSVVIGTPAQYLTKTVSMGDICPYAEGAMTANQVREGSVIYVVNMGLGALRLVPPAGVMIVGGTSSWVDYNLPTRMTVILSSGIYDDGSKKYHVIGLFNN